MAFGVLVGLVLDEALDAEPVALDVLGIRAVDVAAKALALDVLGRLDEARRSRCRSWCAPRFR